MLRLSRSSRQKAAEKVNQLRNNVQHLPNQIQSKKRLPQWSVWGALSWCVPVTQTDLRCYAFLPGKAAGGGGGPIVNPAGRPVRFPVCLITLTQPPTAVCLSDLLDDVAVFAKDFEVLVSTQFAANPTFKARQAADITVCASMSFLPPEPTSTATQQASSRLCTACKSSMPRLCR